MASIKIRKFAALMFFWATLFVAAPQAFAADAAETEGFLKQIFDTSYDETDLAHESLALLFGGFIFEPFGDAPAYPTTVLAHVLGYSNVIAMVLGIVILAYVIMMGAVNTAASGEMLGKRWSTAALPLRITAAFGLIMPAGSGDGVFSVAQSLVIWMIIVGSNSATWLWGKTADIISEGTPIIAASSVYDANSYLPIAKTMFCGAVMDKMYKDKDKKERDIITLTVKGGSPAGHSTGGAGGRGSNSSRQTMTFSEFEAVAGNLSGYSTVNVDNCGTVTIPTGRMNDNSYAKFELGSSGEWTEKASENFEKSVSANISKPVVAAVNFGKHMVENNLQKKNIEGALASNNPEEMEAKILAAAIELEKVSVAYDDYMLTVASSIITDEMAKDFASDMKKGGWVKAGTFFFEASSMQGFVQTLVGKISEATVYDSPESFGFCLFNFFGCDKREEEFDSWIYAPIHVTNELEKRPLGSSQKSNSTVIIKSNFTKVSEGGGQAPSEEMFNSVSVSAAQMFMNSLVYLGEDNAKGTGGSVGDIDVDSTSAMVSPFTVVTGIGRGLQQISVIVWTVGLGVAIAAGASEGNILSGATGLGGAFAAGVKYILATLMPVLAGVSSLAFMLAFALPFMPISMWIMLVCGYFVTAIEALAAISLAVIMMATPEGDGMVGHNFAKALQMVNAIILRPTLSIIGLIAGISLSYVGFSIMNKLFWTVANMATGVSLFEILAIIFIYTTLAYKLCEYMIGIMTKIPDQIMQWMGGGMSREFGETATAGGMTDSLKQNARAGGMGLSGGMNSVSQSYNDRNKPKNRPNNNGGEGASESGGSSSPPDKK